MEYLLGNCAHCHNPRGYPTSIQPLLTDALDFLPSASERRHLPVSARALQSGHLSRGAGQHADSVHHAVADGPPAPRGGERGQRRRATFSSAPSRPSSTRGRLGNDGRVFAAFAPWRSLVYRNVASAFTYEDDIALYPHMPMNTPGFDPRARQRILSDWMISIPCRAKAPRDPRNMPSTTCNGQPLGGGTNPDATLQPYVEVMPGDPRYAAAQSAPRTSGSSSRTARGANTAVPTVLNGYAPRTTIRATRPRHPRSGDDPEPHLPPDAAGRARSRSAPQDAGDSRASPFIDHTLTGSRPT